MITCSMDEVLANYKAAMGTELGSHFFALHRKLIELHILWQQYRQLFGSAPETVRLLNRTSGLFFKIVQDELWDSVLLGISRMTDIEESKGKKNLTLLSLPELISDAVLRAEVKELCDKAKAEASFARDHRNKRIAHQDHGYVTDKTANPLEPISRARVEAMLAALRAVLNRLNAHFCDSTTMYERFVAESGAGVLVQKLERLECLLMVARTP
jgi:AbiU2